MLNSEQKVVWIIGGSGGIGSHIAKRMSNNGWKVIISARNIEKMNEISRKRCTCIIQKYTIQKS